MGYELKEIKKVIAEDCSLSLFADEVAKRKSEYLNPKFETNPNAKKYDRQNGLEPLSGTD